MKSRLVSGETSPAAQSTALIRVRSFRTTYGNEVWDFGDGSPKVTVQSDGNVQVHNPQGYATTTHHYKKPGHYIATVKRRNALGHEAITHLHLCIGINE